MSADRLKAFASIDEASSRNVSANWDDAFEGELLTIKGPREIAEPDLQEQTIRPVPRKTEKTAEPSKAARRRASKPSVSNASQPKSPTKPALGTKFELPSRPEMFYREQSVEDYSDLFADDDHAFDNRLNLVVKVTSPLSLRCSSSFSLQN